MRDSIRKECEAFALFAAGAIEADVCRDILEAAQLWMARKNVQRRSEYTCRQGDTWLDHLNHVLTEADKARGQR